MTDKIAVIKLGGKQHLVTEGAKIKVNQLKTKAGEEISISDVLLVSSGEKVEIGTPLVSGASVTLKITENKKDKKVTVARFKAKSRYRRKVGHRQPISMLEVVSITANKTPKTKQA